MECQVCHRKLVCDYHHGPAGYTEESRYYCPQGHYTESFSYGYTGIEVFDKVFSFDYLTKEKALHSINKNMQSFIKWKLDQQDKCAHRTIIDEKLKECKCKRCGYIVPWSVVIDFMSKFENIRSMQPMNAHKGD